MHVNELAEALHVPQPTVSRHLKVLRERQLVVAERGGTERALLARRRLASSRRWTSCARCCSARLSRQGAARREHGLSPALPPRVSGAGLKALHPRRSPGWRPRSRPDPRRPRWSEPPGSQPSTCGSCAPTIAPLTPGQATTQATATAETVARWRLAIGLRASRRARLRDRAGSVKLARVPAPVVEGHLAHSPGREGVGQDARGHGAVAEHARAVRRSPGDHLGGGAAGQQRERRLHQIHVPDLLAARQKGGVVVADADGPHLALVHSGGSSRPRIPRPAPPNSSGQRIWKRSIRSTPRRPSEASQSRRSSRVGQSAWA